MSLFVLRSADFDPRHRVAEFESAAARICKLQIEAQSPDYVSSTAIALLPDATIASTVHSRCITRRTPPLAAETGDNLLLHVPLAGGFTIRQDGGAELECRPGEIYLDPTEAAGIAHFSPESSHVLYLSVPRAALAEAGIGLAPPLREVLPLSPQWRMLVGYARLLHAEAAALPAGDLALAAAHLKDLWQAALGSADALRPDGPQGGVRAARLAAIKADIEAHLTQPDLSPDWIAARHGISERYLRRLFAAAGTSFSDHVAERRLHLACRRLTDPRLARQTISAIAYDCGFGDISWFNARFRARYGLTPSQLRAGETAPSTR